MSRIIVKNLPNSGLVEEDIKKHFADIDNVTDVKLKYNPVGVFRRFAFVGFKSDDAAERALEKLNNTFIKNSRIVLELCKSIKDIKPEKVNTSKKNDNRTSGRGDKILLTKLAERTKPKASDSKGKQTEDVFEEVKDEVEFKEFLNLQRNLGENSKSKQIWSDDVKMDVENSVETEVEEQKSEAKPDKDMKLETGDSVEMKPKKKHKRSRGKKAKIAKTKPKELFVHTLRVKGFPADVRRKDVKDFFKPLELLSVRLCKRDEVCYVSFKDESDMRFGKRKNLQFHGTSRIQMWRVEMNKTKLFKESMREKVKEKEETFKKYEEVKAETEPLEESGRLFVRNLNYTCTQEDLEEVFSKYGQLTEVHFPIDKKTSLPKGYAYVEFMFPQNATKAYEELNGTIFQGRNFHLIPSKPKPEPAPGQGILTGANRPEPNQPHQSSFKREKLAQQKQNAPRASNWNILFLGQNALADVVSGIKGVEKSELLTQQSRKDPIAVRLALGDTMVVDEMRKFLVSNGIELDSFDNPQAPRSRTVILSKNLPAGTEKNDLMNLFEAHGRVARVIIPPNGLTAIVEMEEAIEAKLAFKKLAYSKYKDSILYLEWAPINVFKEKSLEDQDRSELKQLDEMQTGSKILVKNIPFEATVHELKKVFANFGELNFVRIPKKVDGQHRGFGFVDYLTREDALRAFRALCHSTHLYGRKLVLEWAKSEDGPSSGNQTKQQQVSSSNTNKLLNV